MVTPRPARSLLLLPLFLLGASVGSAQVCAGLPSLHERPVIVSIDGARASSGWSAGGGITAGRTLFGGAFVASATYEDVSFAAQTTNAHSVQAGGGLGYEIALAPDPASGGARVGLCPTVTGEWETGPDADLNGSTLNSDGWTLGAGVSLGGKLLDRPPWRLFPFAAASFVRMSATVHDFPFPGTDTSAREDGWLLAFGLGVGIGPRVTVSPGLTVPTGIEGGENSFNLSINVGFGHAGR